jgi:hypothetical protein
LNIIKQEQTQEWERALRKFLNGLPAPAANDAEAQELLQSIVNTYPGDKASNALPMERFSFVSPMTDPAHILATKSIKEIKISPGALEDMRKRIAASNGACVGGFNVGGLATNTGNLSEGSQTAKA